MSHVWNAQQDAALRAVQQWYLNESAVQQVFRLFGYAGTGKTTLAKRLAEDQSNPMFGAYTGKAALVLRQKGCPASTVHSLIYSPKDKSKKRLRELEARLSHLVGRLSPEQLERGTPELARLRLDVEAERTNVARPSFSLRMDSPLRDASCLFLDECSMIDATMAQDLLSFNVPIVVLGDPAQLPPIHGGGFFTEEGGAPDVMLTDIQRQARDNPIIAMATTIREGGRLEPGSYGDSRVLAVGSRLEEGPMGYEQIIVGRNATRRAWNKRVRELLGRTGPYPEEGDRLVCLRNNHDVGLLNGGIWTVRAALGDVGFISMEIVSEDDPVAPPLTVDAHHEPFVGEKVPLWAMREAEEFDHGYAITCHKAQGSQWRSVLIRDEGGAFRQDAPRWRYTALTRASETVTVML